jgi:hypothetical protein
MNDKIFPQGMTPLGTSAFCFACHAGVGCYMSCCRNLDMVLYPYDLLRLKNRLNIDSETLLRRYTRLGTGSHPYFPAVMLRMADNEAATCPFLGQDGCTVYTDRPSACRTYPLERAVDRSVSGGRPEEYYFLTNHAYCLGHGEKQNWTVKQWLRDQQLFDYNMMNDLWAGPTQQLAFMVCHNLDAFRRFVAETKLTDRFKLESSRRRAIELEDLALLKFGFDWLKYYLVGQPSLLPK